MRRNVVRGLAGLAVGAVGLLVSVSPASAGKQPLATLTAQVSCDSATGNQVISWTFNHIYGVDVSIDAALVDASGLTSGSTISPSATFSPNPVAPDTDSTAQTLASGDATGDYHLTVTYTAPPSSPVMLDKQVVLPGGCVADTTAPTTAAPTTTVTAGSGGQLPSTGADHDVAVVTALVLLGAGGLLLLVRRPARS